MNLFVKLLQKVNGILKKIIKLHKNKLSEPIRHAELVSASLRLLQ